MNPISKTNRITVRLDAELDLNLTLFQKTTSLGKSKIIRMILKDFFDKNDELLNEYYEETKTN